jgi:Winged helix DNA-binding domain
VSTWGFLTNHALVLLCIARDPGARLRDIAASVGITERSAFGIVSDLAEAGYIVKEKGGRRNRYRVEAHLPVPESAGRNLAIGDLLALLGGTDAEHPGTEQEPALSRLAGSTALLAVDPQGAQGACGQGCAGTGAGWLTVAGLVGLATAARWPSAWA